MNRFSCFFRRRVELVAALFLMTWSSVVADGQPEGFDPNLNGWVHAAVVLPDGSFVLAGRFTSTHPGDVGAPARRQGLVRFLGDGSLDRDFAPQFSAPVETLAVDADGRLLAGGGFEAVSEDGVTFLPRTGLVRFLADGSIDPDFAPQFEGQDEWRTAVECIALTPTGDLLVGGSFRTVRASAAENAAVHTQARLVRLSSEGIVDPSFDPVFNHDVLALAVQRDGRVVVGGAFTTIDGTSASRVARLTADGELDASFDVWADNLVRTLAIEVDDSVLIGGDFLEFRGAGETSATMQLFLARVSVDGVLDSTFHPRPSGRVGALAIDHAGRILVGGNFEYLRPYISQNSYAIGRLARLLRNGEVDTSFRPNPGGMVEAVALQEDGGIVVGGQFRSLSDSISGLSFSRDYAARLLENGRVDAAFAPGYSVTINAAAERPDGGTYIGGSFSNLGGQSRYNLALLGPDGEIDPSFFPDLNGSVQAMALQSDGKLVIGGSFTSINEETQRYLARLHPDGTLDTTFDPQPTGVVYEILPESDGSFIVGGAFTAFSPFYDEDDEDAEYDPTYRYYIARVLSDGNVDEDWDPIAGSSVNTIVRQPDGKLLVGGAFTTFGGESRSYLARLETDGSVDPDFAPPFAGPVNAVVVEADGSIIVGGSFELLHTDDGEEDDDDEDEETDDDADRLRLARLAADGSLDLTYTPRVNAAVTSLTLLPDGDVLVGGSFTRFEPEADGAEVAAIGLLRLNPDGTRDEAQVWHTSGSVSMLVELVGNDVLVGGAFATTYTERGASLRTSPPVFRYDPDAGADDAWLPRATVDEGRYVGAVVIQQDGAILAAGEFDDVAGTGNLNVARFTSDGSVDLSYPLRADGAVHALIDRDQTGIWGELRSNLAWLDANGRDLAGVDYSSLAQLTGRINSFLLEPDGSILIGGTFTHTGGETGINLVRLRPDGTFDPDFRPNPDTSIAEMKRMDDGRIVLVGPFTEIAGVDQPYMARIYPDGTFDSSFRPVPASGVSTLALLEDGKIMIGGGFRTFDVDDGEDDDDDFDEETDDDTSQPFIARLNADGTLDRSFTTTTNDFVGSIVVHEDGSMTLGGEFSSITLGEDTYGRSGLARISADGAIDEDFNPSPNGNIWDIVMQPDGKMLLAGEFTLFTNLSDHEDDDDDGDGDTDDDGNDIADEDADVFFLARLNADGTLDTAFAPTPNSTVRQVVVQPDGRILIRGDFQALFPNDAERGTTRQGLARLETDGSLDAAFNPSPDDAVYAMLALEDGRVLIGGDFETLGMEPVLYLGGAYSTINDVDIPRLARVQRDGNPDASFRPAPNGAVRAFLELPDQRLLVAGDFTTLFGASRGYLARLTATGGLDAGFAPTINGPVRAVVRDFEGGLVIAGAFTEVNGAARDGLARLYADGSLDTGWNVPVDGVVEALAVSVDGWIVAGGNLSTVAGQDRSHLFRVSVEGELDAGFAPMLNGRVNAIAVRADNRISVGGAFTTVNGNASPRIATINTDGSLHQAGDAGTNGEVYTLTIDPGGRLLAGGTFSRFGAVSRSLLGRSRPAGSFGQAMRVDADGTGLVWLQTGAAASPATVRVEVSTDNGNTWIGRGFASRLSGADAWRWEGTALPIETEYLVRMRARVPSNRWGGGSRREYVRHFLGTQPSGYGYASTLPSLFVDQQENLGAGLPGGADIVIVFPGDGDSGSGGTGDGEGGAVDVLSNRLSNVSTRVQLAGSDSLTLGFVIEGSAARRMLLRAVGPGLGPYIGTGMMAEPKLVLRRAGGALIGSNAGWISSSQTRSWFTQVGAFSLDTGSRDAVLAPELEPGAYTLTISDEADAGGVVLAEIYDLGSVATPDRLTNLSTLSRAGTGDATFVVGFVVKGTTPKQLLLRAVGPGLEEHGVTTALEDVAITVYDANGRQVARNEDWNAPLDGGASADSIDAAAASAGAFALQSGSADAAVVVTLPPGAYTAQLTPRTTTGTHALIEIYELSP